MSALPEGNAIVYCDGGFGTPNGKTAHGLVRFTRRYRVMSVISARHAGADAGEVLDGRSNGIPLVANLAHAISRAEADAAPATHLVIGLAPDGGRLPPEARRVVADAIRAGLHVDSGLHDFLSEDDEFAALARANGVRLRDVRKPPPRDQLHFFSGKIEQVTAQRIAVLGTDSAIGKRTTAVKLVEAFEQAGMPAELVGTGQTSWMQGVRYGLILDSLINDFVAGEIEHAVWSAWEEADPRVIVLEGQGSLMNPAYPGGFELLAAGRPHAVVLQHAPARKEYDGFPGYPLHALGQQIQAIEIVSGRPVVAITINHENMKPEQTRAACQSIAHQTGLETFDVLLDGALVLAQSLARMLAISDEKR
ncbi:MAG: DUF1611 domain-containing protein [Acidobacteriota bacterium]|nr:MAG: DUF1611 domain-containing protein [Acidobacteriota bacterium]